MRQVLRNIGSWILRASASAFLLWLVVRKIDQPALRQVFQHIHWGWFAAAFAVMLFSRALSCTRLIVLVRAKGMAFEPKAVARIVLASEFFGSFLPASIGGDVIRFYSLAQHTNDRSESASAVLAERSVGVVALLLFGGVGALWAWTHLADHRIIWAAFTPSIVGMLLAPLVFSERVVSAVARWVGLHQHRFVSKLLKWQETVRAYRHHRKEVAQALGFSMGIHLCRITSAFCVSRALGATIPYGYFAAFVPMILLIALLPISIGGLGVRENAYVYCFGQVGMAPVLAFSVSIVAHALSVIAHVPGGVWSVWGTHRERRQETKASAAARLRALWVADKLGYGDRLHGVGQYYLTVIPALRTVEIVPAVLRSTNGLASHFEAHGIALRQFHRGRFNPLTLWTLLRTIRREHIDVLHVHGYGASAFGRLAGWLTRTPVIVHQHDSSARAWYIRGSDWVLRALTTRAIAVSGQVKQFCITERAIQPSRISILMNAVTPTLPAQPQELHWWRDELGLDSGSKVIGSITRFHPIKGTRYLVEAMPKILRDVPTAYLVLWGDGPEREPLEAQARTLGVADRVHFAGFQPDASRRLPLVDCFVLPSVSEGIPFALLEALAAGRPIVATRVGGIPDVVRDGQEALLVPPQDAGAIATAVARVLQDETLANRLSAASSAASRRYTMNAHVAALEQLYAEVVA